MPLDTRLSSTASPPVVLPDNDDQATYTVMCAAFLIGAVVSVFVGGRAILGFSDFVREHEQPPDTQRLRAGTLDQRLRQLANDRRAWVDRLVNPMSAFLLNVVLVQCLQSVVLSAFAIAALARPERRCYVHDPAHPYAPSIAPHIITSQSCDVSAFIDALFDDTAIMLIAWFLALIAFPSLHSHAPADGNCHGRIGFTAAWVLSLLTSAIWNCVAYFALPKSHPGRSKFHRLLPWCWSPDASAADSWADARLGVEIAAIVALVVLGVCASIRVRTALRQYRRAVNERYADPVENSPMASFIRSRELPKRVQRLTVVYVLVFTLAAVWRLAPIPQSGSNVMVGLLSLLVPCNGAITALVWAVAEGVFAELYLPLCTVDGWRRLRCCCCRRRNTSSDDYDTLALNASSQLVAHGPAMEPLPFTHIIYAANRFVERRAAERRWFNYDPSDATQEGVSEQEEDPSRVYTAGPSPVP